MHLTSRRNERVGKPNLLAEMKEMEMKTKNVSLGMKGLVAAGLLGLCAWAEATPVMVYEDAGFISGTAAVNNTFQLSAAGRYRATLTDLHFGDSFRNLTLNIGDGTNDFGIIPRQGSIDFNAGPGTYYMDILGQAGASSGLGLYGVQIVLLPEAAGDPLPSPPGGGSPVPLPATLGLLASAMAVLVGLINRREDGEEADFIGATI